MGIFMCLVGIIYCIVGGTSVRRAVDKRQSLFSRKKLRDRFNEADKEGNGSLRLSQFRNLIQMLDVQISDAEAEVIYTHYQQSSIMGMKFKALFIRCLMYRPCAPKNVFRPIAF